MSTTLSFTFVVVGLALITLLVETVIYCLCSEDSASKIDSLKKYQSLTNAIMERKYGTLGEKVKTDTNYVQINWFQRNSKFVLGGVILILLACLGVLNLNNEKKVVHSHFKLTETDTGRLVKRNFTHAYIQNVKSGSCVTINKDALLNPLSASKCDCHPYQFWNMENEKHVINQLATYGYMDELFGFPQDGKTVGIYSLTGLPWQQWNLKEDDVGNYHFVVQHTGKCLHQGKEGTIDQWACENDPSQQWRIIENPCGKLPKLESDLFQLQNPGSGICAGIRADSNVDWETVVTRKCACDNKYQYWKLAKKTLLSEGSKKCMANWDAQGHPGVTQCICAPDGIHRFVLSPYQDGSFTLVSGYDGRCVYVDSQTENTVLRFGTCDRNNATQRWTFYDTCHPAPPPNVIPPNLKHSFGSGEMNWLTPTRYKLLVGGHWDQVNIVWRTPNGTGIKPGTADWTEYFGDAKTSVLKELFQGGKSWNEVFSWMTIDFFTTWTSWKSTTTKTISTVSQSHPVIPNHMVTFFDSGKMNWLTPERYNLLTGGRWDATTQVWYTPDGKQIRPQTSEWAIYFGDQRPSDLSQIFTSNGSWDSTFGWMTPDFFQERTPGSRAFEVHTRTPGFMPTATCQRFASAQFSWLTPERARMLAGGKWTGFEYITRSGEQVVPGSRIWREYFDSADAEAVNSLFGGPGYWDTTFNWLPEIFQSQSIRRPPVQHDSWTYTWTST